MLYFYISEIFDSDIYTLAIIFFPIIFVINVCVQTNDVIIFGLKKKKRKEVWILYLFWSMMIMKSFMTLIRWDRFEFNCILLCHRYVCFTTCWELNLIKVAMLFLLFYNKFWRWFFFNIKDIMSSYVFKWWFYIYYRFFFFF